MVKEEDDGDGEVQGGEGARGPNEGAPERRLLLL